MNPQIFSSYTLLGFVFSGVDWAVFSSTKYACLKIAVSGNAVLYYIPELFQGQSLEILLLLRLILSSFYSTADHW